MIQLTTEEILKMDLETAFKTLNIIKIDEEIDKNDKKKLNEAYWKARNGIKIEFDIYDLLALNYSEKANKGIIIMNKGKKWYNASEFYTEIEERETAIKKAIIDSIKEEDTIAPR